MIPVAASFGLRDHLRRRRLRYVGLPPDHSMTARRAQEARGFVLRRRGYRTAPRAQIDSMDSLRHPEGRLPKARAGACWHAAMASQRDPPADFRPAPPPRDLPSTAVAHHDHPPRRARPACRPGESRHCRCRENPPPGTLGYLLISGSQVRALVRPPLKPK
jgi:hypothetical protein